jgi:hypothetical protein
MIARVTAIGLTLCALSKASCTSTSASAASDCRMFQPQSIGRETTGTPRAPRWRASWHLGRKFEHVVIVLFENQDYDMVL